MTQEVFQDGGRPRVVAGQRKYTSLGTEWSWKGSWRRQRTKTWAKDALALPGKGDSMEKRHDSQLSRFAGGMRAFLAHEIFILKWRQL